MRGNSIQGLRFLCVALAFALMPQGAWADGINTSNATTDLPIGAGGTTFMRVLPSGAILFDNLAADTSTATAKAWIDTTSGTASFASVTFDTSGLNATGPVTMSKTLSVLNTGAASTAVDVTAAHRMAAGDLINGGNGGLQVGPSQFFGSKDSTDFGLWWGSDWGLLLNTTNGNVGIGALPAASDKLNVGGQVNALQYTASGGAGSALTGQDIDVVNGLNTVPTCTATQALQKTGANTFACVSLTAGTATGNAALFQGQMMYNPTSDQMYYWDIPTQNWIPVANVVASVTCPTVASGSTLITSNGTFSPPAGVSSSCPLTVRVLVVGGGGAGGSGGYANGSCPGSGAACGAGGGGAGSGYVSAGTVNLTSSSTIPVTVGGSGGASSFGSYLTATAGGNGGNGNGSAAGGNGGNGAGGGGGAPTSCGTYPGWSGGGGTIGQPGYAAVAGAGGCGGPQGSAGSALESTSGWTSTTINGVTFKYATFSLGAGSPNGVWDSSCCGDSGDYAYGEPGTYGYGAGGTGGGGGSNTTFGGGGGGGSAGGLLINGSGPQSGQGGTAGDNAVGAGGAGAPGVVYVEWD